MDEKFWYFGFLGVHWKIQLSGVGEFTKSWYRQEGGLPKKGGREGGGLARKRGVFEGGLIPQCTLCKPQYLFNLIQTGQDSYNTGNFDQVQT